MNTQVEIPDRLYFRIGDVAEIIGVKPYVLRYWETEFAVVSPQKSTTGQRVYRRVDVENLLLIKHLLYEQRFSIEGARRRLRELRKEERVALAADIVKDPQQITVEPVQENPVQIERIKTIAAEIVELSKISAEEIFTS